MRDVALAPAHGERLAVEALSLALRTVLFELEPLDPRVEHVVFGAGARALVGPFHLVDGEAGAVARRAPAMLGVVRKQARIELREAAPAGAAGALGGEHLHPLLLQDMHHAFADLEGLAEELPQLALGLRRDANFAERQLDRVLLEAVDARKRPRGNQLPVHAQMPIAARQRPFG